VFLIIFVNKKLKEKNAKSSMHAGTGQAVDGESL
jgi:hypothetical protein